MNDLVYECTLAELKAKILSVACSLQDDPNYNKEDAIKEIIEISKFIDRG